MDTISVGTRMHMFSGIHCNAQISLFLYIKIIFIWVLCTKSWNKCPKPKNCRISVFYPLSFPDFNCVARSSILRCLLTCWKCLTHTVGLGVTSPVGWFGAWHCITSYFATNSCTIGNSKIHCTHDKLDTTFWITLQKLDLLKIGLPLNVLNIIRKTPSLLFHAFHAFLCFYQWKK